MARRKTTDTDVVEQPQEPNLAASLDVVNNGSSPTDSMALTGHFVDVIAGEYAGAYGVYERTLELDPTSGLPSRVLVITRDDDSLYLAVDYEDVVPARPGRR